MKGSFPSHFISMLSAASVHGDSAASLLALCLPSYRGFLSPYGGNVVLLSFISLARQVWVWITCICTCPYGGESVHDKSIIYSMYRGVRSVLSVIHHMTFSAGRTSTAAGHRTWHTSRALMCFGCWDENVWNRKHIHHITIKTWQHM